MAFQYKTILRNYGNILLLLTGIIAGSLIGVFFPEIGKNLKPIGDIFLNLLFVTIVPLIIFAISSSISKISADHKLGRILFYMSITFLAGILLAAVYAIIVLWIFPIQAPSHQAAIHDLLELKNNTTWGEKMVSFFTVDEFNKLLSRQSMFALVIFSFLLGMAIRKSGNAGKLFGDFMNSGNIVVTQLLLYIMKMAPLGLGAYFAFQVATLGTELFGFYAKPLGLYYSAGFLYFIVFFSLFAFIAYGKKGVSLFWKNNISPSLTAIATCSSMATMPVNLLAAKKIGLSENISSVVIPLGMTLHKQGSAISSIFKIYVAFVIIGKDFFEPVTLLSALGITLLVSIVAGGIPNGGYIGEMLMISVYGMPTEAIPAIMIISTLVDPLATLLNATADTTAAMLTSKIMGIPLQKSTI